MKISTIHYSNKRKKNLLIEMKKNLIGNHIFYLFEKHSDKVHNLLCFQPSVIMAHKKQLFDKKRHFQNIFFKLNLAPKKIVFVSLSLSIQAVRPTKLHFGCRCFVINFYRSVSVSPTNVRAVLIHPRSISDCIRTDFQHFRSFRFWPVNRVANNRSRE